MIEVWLNPGHLAVHRFPHSAAAELWRRRSDNRIDDRDQLGRYLLRATAEKLSARTTLIGIVIPVPPKEDDLPLLWHG